MAVKIVYFTQLSRQSLRRAVESYFRFSTMSKCMGVFELGLHRGHVVTSWWRGKREVSVSVSCVTVWRYRDNMPPVRSRLHVPVSWIFIALHCLSTEAATWLRLL